MKLTLFLIFLCASPLEAQETQPLAAPESMREAFNRLGDGLVAAQLAGEVWRAAKAEDKSHAFGCLALESAIAFSMTELLKHAVHRTRPDGSDNLSWPSGHSMAAALYAGRPGWTWGVAVTVPLTRGLANKHYVSDWLGGALIGATVRQLCDY